MTTPVFMRVLTAFGLLLSLTLLFTSCKDADTDRPGPDTPQGRTVTLSGLVLDEDGRTLAGVTVRSGDREVVSATDGKFTLTGSADAKNRCVLEAEKDGFFLTTRAIQVSGSAAATNLTLTALGDPQVFTAGEATNLTVNGMQIALPAGALMKDGEPYEGEAQAYVRYIDPADPALGRLMPGGDMQAVRTDGAATMLVTYGAVRVELEADGEPLQLAEGRPATLRFPAGTALDTRIPLWHFDEEAGVWKEEGAATRQGDAYVGTVSHFSSWNLDGITDAAVAEGILADCQGRPLAWVPLKVGQLEVLTGADGKFGVRVPAGQPIKIYTAWLSGGLMEVGTIPALADQAQQNIGTLQICLPAITGRLVDCQGQPTGGAAHLTTPEGVIVSSTAVSGDGVFVLTGPAGLAVNFLGVGLNSGITAQIPTQLPTGGTPKDIGSQAACDQGQNAGAGHVAYNITGDGYSGQRVVVEASPANGSVAIGYYTPNVNESTLALGHTEGGLYKAAMFNWKGSGIGTFISGEDFVLGSALTIKPDGTPGIYYETASQHGCRLTMVVTHYDPVGGRIKGVFSGKLRKRIGTNPRTDVEVTISDGTFDLPRQADR